MKAKARSPETPGPTFLIDPFQPSHGLIGAQWRNRIAVRIGARLFRTNLILERRLDVCVNQELYSWRNPVASRAGRAKEVRRAFPEQEVRLRLHAVVAHDRH